MLGEKVWPERLPNRNRRLIEGGIDSGKINLDF